MPRHNGPVDRFHKNKRDRVNGQHQLPLVAKRLENDYYADRAKKAEMHADERRRHLEEQKLVGYIRYLYEYLEWNIARIADVHEFNYKWVRKVVQYDVWAGVDPDIIPDLAL